jgi:methylamine dehydrogenase accessory protein MauD
VGGHLALAVVVLGILRQITPVLERAAAQMAALGPGHEGPPVGEQVPEFAARDTDGQLVSDQELRGRPFVLLFLSAGCGPCERLAAEIRRADLGALASQLIIIVTSPDAPRVLGIPAGLRIVTESSNEITNPLDIQGLPFAVAVDPGGTVQAAEVPSTVKHLDRLAAVLA